MLWETKKRRSSGAPAQCSCALRNDLYDTSLPGCVTPVQNPCKFGLPSASKSPHCNSVECKESMCSKQKATRQKWSVKLRGEHGYCKCKRFTGIELCWS
eukprot:1159175-Pelagomonas_calceolata.AAC.7